MTQKKARAAGGPGRAHFALVPPEPITDPKLSRRAKLLLTALSLHVWDDVGECTLTNRQLGDLTGCCERTIRRGLAALKRWGYVTLRTEKTGTGDQRIICVAKRGGQLRVTSDPPGQNCPPPRTILTAPPGQF